MELDEIILKLKELQTEILRHIYKDESQSITGPYLRESISKTIELAEKFKENK